MNRALFTVTVSMALWAIIIAGVLAVWFLTGDL